MHASWTALETGPCKQQDTYEHVHGANVSNDFTNGYMTWLKSNEPTRILAGSNSVSEHEVQNDGLTRMAGFEGS